MMGESPDDTTPEGHVPNDLERIYREHGRYVLDLMRRHFGLPMHLAEDLAQDVFEVVLEKLDDVPEDQRASTPAMRAWVFRIAWNLVANFRKRLSFRKEELCDSPPEVSYASRAEIQTHARELAGWLDEMSPVEKHIFVGFEVYGMTARELGKQVGLTEAEVRKTLDEVRRRLRRDSKR